MKAGATSSGAVSADRAVALPKFRVLVCAQSNAAIDEVIGRLASPGLLTGAVLFFVTFLRARTNFPLGIAVCDS